MHLTILLTSAGVATAQNVILALKKSNKYTLRFVGVDADPLITTEWMYDRFIKAPDSNSKHYLSFLLKLVEEESIDFIFPLHSSEILFFAENIKEFNDIGARLSISSPLSISTCIDKYKFSNFLSKFNYPAPKTYKITDEDIRFPVFVKPTVGSSSKGAKRVDSRHDLNLATQATDKYFIIQEYIDCDEITVDCFVNKQSILIGCVPRLRIKVKDGKSVITRTISDKRIQHLCTKLVKSLNYSGPCNIQMFYSEDKISIIEMNPRLSAGGLLLTTEAGVNIPELMLDEFYSQIPPQPINYTNHLTMLSYTSYRFS